jgi:hypothetical protein
MRAPDDEGAHALIKGEPIHILLVEDDPAHSEAVRRALKASGMNVVVREAGTLRAYRELAAAHPPDIAILDLSLPDGRAVEVLISPPEAGPFPIVVMSSQGDEQKAAEAMKAGALDYIVKSPEAFAGMPRTVERVLNGWDMLQERKRAEETLQIIFDSVPVMIAFFDSEGHYQLVNRCWQSTLGWSLEEAMYKDVLTGFYPDPVYREYVLDYIKRAAGSWGDFKTRTRDGRVLDTSWINVSLSDGSSIGIGIDITDRKKVAENLRRQTAVTEAINRVFQGALQVKTDAEVARFCLSEAEELTGSKFGWIGEVNPSGRLDTIALSAPAWDACRIPGAQPPMIRDMEIRGIFSRVLKDGKPLITNEPAAHPDRVGLPSGHPELTAFLGVPLKQDGRTVGMIALGNKPSGYAPHDQEAIEALSGAFAAALQRQRAAEAVQVSLREKEILLREIHHRVKNNMQVISSLFNLQAGYIKDKEALRILKEGQTRIRSMALVHEKLYQSGDLSKIDLAGYIRSLSTHLFQVYLVDPNQVRLETEFEDVPLDINTAVPCGLILNELISNALKHAFPAGRKGVLMIRLRRGKDGAVELRIADNGVGFPKGLDFRRTESLGLQIVSLLVGQLEGTIKLARKNGTAFTVAFHEMKQGLRI